MVTSVPAEDKSLRMCPYQRRNLGGAFRTLTAQTHVCAQLHAVLGLAHTQLSDKVDQACQETSQLSAFATNLLCLHPLSIKPLQHVVQATEREHAPKPDCWQGKSSLKVRVMVIATVLVAGARESGKRDTTLRDFSWASGSPGSSTNNC